MSLAAARYGKDRIRVFRVVRKGDWHHVVEYSVRTLVEGDIAVSYTEANNQVVVATDSIKNITYYISKISPHVLNPEKFALHLATHIVSKYTHLRTCHVDVESLRWQRIPVEGNAHPHSFYRDGDEIRFTSVSVSRSTSSSTLKGTVSSGLRDLLILKSTGSSFTNFVRDEYTTLAEVDDRIFSTSVDLNYTFDELEIKVPADEKKLEFIIPEVKAGGVWDEKVWDRARKVTCEVFATDDSASVQATLFKMSKLIISQNPGINTVSYSLPNKHYVPVDLSRVGYDVQLDEMGKVIKSTTNQGLQNGLGREGGAEVFVPLAAPSGLITATVARD